MKLIGRRETGLGRRKPAGKRGEKPGKGPPCRGMCRRPWNGRGREAGLWRRGDFCRKKGPFQDENLAHFWKKNPPPKEQCQKLQTVVLDERTTVCFFNKKFIFTHGYSKKIYPLAKNRAVCYTVYRIRKGVLY